MKQSVSIFNFAHARLAVLVLSVFFSACSGGGGDGTITQSGASQKQVVNISELGGTLDNDGTWKVADKLFVSGGEGSRTQSNQADIATIVVGDDVFDNSNGFYSGGRIRITLTLAGSGLYTVTDKNIFTAAIGSGTKVASIIVTAGTLSNNETQWATTVTSGTVTVTVNSEGRYFVSTTEPLILMRILDIGTGIPGSPDQVLYSMRNINGVIIQ